MELERAGVLCYQIGMSELRSSRKAKNLTQQALADMAGTSQPQIKRLEEGERKLTKEWAERLAPHLDTSPERLMFGRSKADLAEDNDAPSHEDLLRRLARELKSDSLIVDEASLPGIVLQGHALLEKEKSLTPQRLAVFLIETLKGARADQALEAALRHSGENPEHNP